MLAQKASTLDRRRILKFSLASRKIRFIPTHSAELLPLVEYATHVWPILYFITAFTYRRPLLTPLRITSGICVSAQVNSACFALTMDYASIYSSYALWYALICLSIEKLSCWFRYEIYNIYCCILFMLEFHDLLNFVVSSYVVSSRRVSSINQKLRVQLASYVDLCWSALSIRMEKRLNLYLLCKSSWKFAHR